MHFSIPDIPYYVTACNISVENRRLSDVTRKNSNVVVVLKIDVIYSDAKVLVYHCTHILILNSCSI